MVNRTRLRDAVEEARETLATVLANLETRVQELDEPAPTIETGDEPTDAYLGRIHELETQITDLRREHAAEVAAASSGDADRYRQIIERRDREIQTLRAEIDTTRGVNEGLHEANEILQSRLDLKTHELDDLKHKVLPSMEELSAESGRKIDRYEPALEFYAVGHADGGERALRALGRMERPSFDNYVKPGSAVESS